MSNRVKVLKTSTERLLAVADIVEANDERWEQGEWSAITNYDPTKIHERHTCGAYGCIAGWGVAMTPKSAPIDIYTHWREAGSIALGVDASLCADLFSGYLADDLRPDVRRRRVAKALRWLATLPEEERTSERWGYILKILDGTARPKVA